MNIAERNLSYSLTVNGRSITRLPGGLVHVVALVVGFHLVVGLGLVRVVERAEPCVESGMGAVSHYLVNSRKEKARGQVSH